MNILYVWLVSSKYMYRLQSYGKSPITSGSPLVYSCPRDELFLPALLESLFSEMKKIMILKSAMKLADEIYSSLKDEALIEPRCEKTGFLHMRKQRRRTAQLISAFVFHTVQPTASTTDYCFDDRSG